MATEGYKIKRVEKVPPPAIRGKWVKRAEQAERKKLEIKVTFKGEVLFHEKGPADDVISRFKAFLRDRPEILPLTCSGKIHLHPRAPKEASK